MIQRTRSSSAAALLALAAAAALGAPGAASAPATTSLDVPGKADATPWVAASGSFVAAVWGASSGAHADVFLAISRDGGVTFAAPRRINDTPGEARLGGELPPRVALVRRPGVAVPDIAVLWTTRSETTGIKVARSSDGGQTFTTPVTLQSTGAPGDRGWPAVAFDERAAIHAIWLDHRGLAKNRAGGGHAAHQRSAGHDGVAMAQQSGLYYASAATRTSPERQLTAGVCYCCKTALASGADGSLYAAWRHVYEGNLRDIAFTMSRDGGRSFSSPVRVRQDGWAIAGCPDDGPAMAVDARGTVHLVWPTVVGGSEPEGAIFYASTRDGRAFTPGIRVPTLGGPKPSHPHIVVDGRGRLFAAWDESVEGRRVAAMREIRVRTGGAPSFGEIVVLSPDAGLYPVLAATNTGIVAVWTAPGQPSTVKARVISE